MEEKVLLSTMESIISGVLLMIFAFIMVFFLLFMI